MVWARDMMALDFLLGPSHLQHSRRKRLGNTMLGVGKAKKQDKAPEKSVVFPSVLRIDRVDFPIESFGVVRMRIGNVDDDIVPGMHVHATLPLHFHNGEEEHVPILAMVYGIQERTAALRIEDLSPMYRKLIQEWVTEATEKGALPPKPASAPADHPPKAEKEDG